MVHLNKPADSATQYSMRENRFSMFLLFDGPIPTKADVEYALLQSKEINYSNSLPGHIGSKMFLDWAAARSNNLVGYSQVDSFITKERIDDYFSKFPMSRNTQEFEGLVDAAIPTWFAYFRTGGPTVYSILNYNSLVVSSIFGTVGDESSNANLKLPGGIIDASSSLKTNDLVIEEF